MSPLRRLGLLGVLLILASTLAWSAQDGSGDRVAKLNREGIAFFERGEYRRALSRFESALKLEPQSKQIRENIGRTYTAVGIQLLNQAEALSSGPDDIRRALEQFNLGLLYWEGDLETLHALSWCHIQLGELKSGEAQLERALELDRKSFKSWRLLGVCLERQNRLRAALKAYREALELNPEDPEVKLRHHRIKNDLTALEEYPVEKRGAIHLYAPSSYNAPQRRIIIEAIEKTLSDYLVRWDITPPSKIVVIAYEKGQFAVRTGLSKDIGGAFDGRIRVAHPDELEEGDLELQVVLRHETVHLLLRQLSERAPRWLDEGIAQALDGGTRGSWRGRLLELLRGDPDRGIADRERQFREDRPETYSALYLHGLFLVDYLIERYGAFRLDMVVREVKGGSSWLAALERVYGQPIERIDSEWRAQLLESERPKPAGESSK